MDKELVYHPEQGLVWKSVVENYEQADLGQLEGEVARKQEALDAKNAQIETLVAERDNEASDLEVSKSNAERGRALVESQATNASSEDLGGEVLADSVTQSEF